MRVPKLHTLHLFIIFVSTLLALSILGGCERVEKQAPPAAEDAPAPLADAQVPASREEASAQKGDAEPSLRVVASNDLPADPKRIVTLAPNVTEVLFAIGAGERVVAVTRYDDYPPEVKKLPKIGGIIDVDLEALLAQKPDLVVGTSAGSDGTLVAKLEKSKIPYLFVQMNTLQETYDGIQKFGDTIGLGQNATEVRADMKSKIDAISQSASKKDNNNNTPRPSVLLVYGHDPLVVAGPGSFGHEILELAGAKNAVGDSKNAYPVLDIEKILSLDPDRIIDATIAPDGPDKADAPSPAAAFWSKYDTLSAVKNKQVHYFDDPVLHRPAPRLVEGLKIMHKAINADPADAARTDD